MVSHNLRKKSSDDPYLKLFNSSCFSPSLNAHFMIGAGKLGDGAEQVHRNETLGATGERYFQINDQHPADKGRNDSRNKSAYLEMDPVRF